MPQDFSGTQQQEAQGARDRQHSAPQKGPNLVASIREDIRSLGSSILIITQKMKYLVRNEKNSGKKPHCSEQKNPHFRGNNFFGRIRRGRFPRRGGCFTAA